MRSSSGLHELCSGELCSGLHKLSSAVAEPLPGLRFKDVMIPAVKKHYRGKGIKKFYICCDGATAFNNLDKARTVE